jgi:glycosyltransferase involved in cell wall biosynthesis
LKSDFPDFKLVLIGHNLEDDARKSFPDLDGRIEFRPGLYFDELKDYYRRCYCLALPSRTEGMGRVLLEAMACGKPVIGSKVGGIPSIIDDGVNGFLFEKENEQELAHWLNKLLSDPSLAMRMGQEGRKMMKERFSSHKYLGEYAQMVSSVVDQGNHHE